MGERQHNTNIVRPGWPGHAQLMESDAALEPVGRAFLGPIDKAIDELMHQVLINTSWTNGQLEILSEIFGAGMGVTGYGYRYRCGYGRGTSTGT